MLTLCNKKHYVLTITTAALTLIFSFIPSSVFAQPGFDRSLDSAKSGNTFDDMGTFGYVFKNGIFYKNEQKGYVVARAPQGVVVEDLPSAAALVYVDNTPYFTYAGVYYKKLNTGYVVVPEPIRQGGLTMDDGTRLQVNVEFLNVRSGPSLNHDIVFQIRQNDVFNVKAIDGSWCLIRIDDATEGWVNSRYTTHLENIAEG